MPETEKIGTIARRKLDQAQSRAQMRDAQLDPSINPAGKGKFEGTYAPFTKHSDHYTYAKPDPGHAARLRGAKAKAKSSNWKTPSTPPVK